MSALQIFETADFSVRSVVIDGEPWFVAKDICQILGLQNPTMALEALDEDEKGLSKVETLGGAQNLRVVNESGLYALMVRSNKPEAKPFRKWVTHEVLPAIRRTGTYTAAPAPAPAPVALPGVRELALMVIAEADRADAAEARVAELAPAAAFAEQLTGTGQDFDLREAAQILDRDPQITTGQRRLQDTLKAWRWLDKTGQPYQGQVDNGRLVRRIHTFRDRDGVLHTRSQVRVTPKGLQVIHGKLGGSSEIVLMARLELVGA